MEFSFEVNPAKPERPSEQAAGLTAWWSGPNTPLWQAIERFPLDDPRASMSFSARLARDHLWLQTYADKVIREYRRFLYLAATEPEMVTPSEDVDEVWHLHLAYTQSYWDDLSGEVLKRPLHHSPTGGSEETSAFHKAYDRTLRRYFQVFGETPPRDVWPKQIDRFALNAGFRTVPLRDFHLVGRAWKLGSEAMLYILLLAFLIFAAIALGLTDTSIESFVVSLLLVGVPLFPLWSIFRRQTVMPVWGTYGVGYDKYQEETEKNASSSGGCGGCGGCGG